MRGRDRAAGRPLDEFHRGGGARIDLHDPHPAAIIDDDVHANHPGQAEPDEQRSDTVELPAQRTRNLRDGDADRAAPGEPAGPAPRAAEQLPAGTEQFRAGAGLITELMAATADLARAQLDLVSAAIDARIAYSQLVRAIGADGPFDVGSPR